MGGPKGYGFWAVYVLKRCKFYTHWTEIGYFSSGREIEYLVYNHNSSSSRPGSGMLSRNMVGQVYFCYICFTKLNVSLIIKLDVLPCLNILF